MALSVPALARLQGQTLIYILAGQTIGGQLVPVRTATPVTAGLIVALAHTLVSLLTLVNINTRPAVCGEFVALPAVAPVGTPQVCAVVTANVGDLLALIDVHTRLASRLEALLADTSVRP